MDLVLPNPIGLRPARGSLSSLPPTIDAIARALANNPQYRSVTLGQVARALSQAWPAVRTAAAAVIQALQRVGDGDAAGAALALAPALEHAMRQDASMDQLIAQLASRADRPALSPRPQGVGGRAVFVPHPRMLAATLRYLPQQARHLPQVRYWMQRAPYAHMADAGDPLLGKATAGTTYYASSPSTQWVYTIQSGDTPRGRTKAITGDENRWVEMIPYNPSFGTQGTPGTLGYNFKYFQVGKGLNIPKEWNQYIPEQGVFPLVPGTVLPANPMIGGGPVIFPVPSGGGGSDGTYLSTLPAGAVTAIKLQLGAWRTKEGSAATSQGIASDYPSPMYFEINDTADERWLAAVRAFQRWANATKGSKLRTDGLLDKPTNDAINAYVAGTLGGAAPSPGSPLPPGMPIPPVVLPGGGGGTGTPLPLPPIPTSPPILPSTPIATKPAEKKSSGGGAVVGLLAAAALATQLIK